MRDAATTHRLFLVARHELVGRVPVLDGPAVLFEGSWPDASPPESRRALDDEIDARFAWIDRAASRLAEQLGDPMFLPDADEPGSPPINSAWLNALALRYYLAKLLRLVAYFTEIRPLEAGDRVRLIAARGRDEDYASCMEELCRLAGASCRVEWVVRPERPAQRFPRNGRWRRGLARLCRLLDPPRSASPSPPRVVLCGNPRFLDPVCRELLRRNCRVWWLYDRFAIRSWLRWRPLGVGQLVCESSDAGGNRLSHAVPERLECRGVNLAEPARRWLADRLRTYGPRQTRIVARIDGHFRRVRPQAVVLTDDATPMARAAAALARRHEAASLVVQHGAPVCRFGFAPLSADRILVWGRSSRDQLTRWDVPAERIDAVGSPWHERLNGGPSREGRTNHAGRLGSSAASPEGWRPRILLLATTPPHDDRPDAVALHLTGRTYAEMLRTALAAVSAIPGAELIVKLHPRAPNDPIAHAVLAEFPAVRIRVVTGGAVEPWFDEVDCVLSCFSSAGIDATLAGVPVIQLLPRGSGDVLPHDEWGMLGTARSEAELAALLLQALGTRRKTAGWVERSETHVHTGRPSRSAPNPNVFADLGRSAASTIAEAILAARQPARKGTLGATAGLSSSAGHTVGQANRATRRFDLETPIAGPRTNTKWP